MKRELIMAALVGALATQIQAEPAVNAANTQQSTAVVPASTSTAASVQQAPNSTVQPASQSASAQIVQPQQSVNMRVQPSVQPAATTTASAQPALPAAQKFANEVDRVSYAIGVNIGESFKSQGVSINASSLYQGVQAGLGNSQAALMTSDEVHQALIKFQQDQMQKQQQELLGMAKKNQAASDAFFVANKIKPGIKTLANGLQYKILEQGKGIRPSSNDTVKVDYEGKLLDGKVFDSSYQRGTPASFPVKAVIPGWTQVLQMMPVGSTWEVYIPPQLAYGERGAGNMIEPNSALIFKIHLIDVQKATKAIKK